MVFREEKPNAKSKMDLALYTIDAFSFILLQVEMGLINQEQDERS